MSKQILQVENTNSVDLTTDIVEKVVTKLHTIWGSNQNNNDEIFLTRQETAELLSVSLVTIWDWTRKDILAAYRIGNKIRYKKSEVLLSITKRNQF